ncbi:phosphate/phosphite/phosphonate ABC transporter substrate-binding protein [bacterium]|nr:phosphate/phosphite/phosphonate ABC transporter substrate-binding protein [bacterium]
MRNAICIMLLIMLAGGCYKPASESQPLGSEDNPLIMAFVPSTEAEKVIASAEEMIDLLEQDTGLHFKTLGAPSYVGIVEAMAVGKVQVAWLPPMAYVFAHQRNGDEVILKVVRNGKPTYRGQIVVMADSGIESLDDLRGKRIAFTDATSASGHYYPSALLREAGIDPETDLEVIYAGGHDAAVLALVKGSVDAACCYDDARSKLIDLGFPDINETTRILAFTPDIPADNVAVIKDLDPELTAKVRQGLLDLAATEEGARVLMELYEIEGLVPAVDSDYEPVRRMAELLDKDIEEEVRQGG